MIRSEYEEDLLYEWEKVMNKPIGRKITKADYKEEVKLVLKELKELREILIAIRDYGNDTESGYPEEIAYDEFAYNRIVESYRDAARKGLEK